MRLAAEVAAERDTEAEAARGVLGAFPLEPLLTGLGEAETFDGAVVGALVGTRGASLVLGRLTEGDRALVEFGVATVFGTPLLAVALGALSGVAGVEVGAALPPLFTEIEFRLTETELGRLGVLFLLGVGVRRGELWPESGASASFVT